MEIYISRKIPVAIGGKNIVGRKARQTEDV
jgi:hypothetical protein